MKDVVLPLIYSPVQPCKDLSRVSLLMDMLSLLRWDNILIYSFHHCHEGTKQTDITNEDLAIT